MVQDGYWALFWQTGLPQAYLAAKGEQAGPRRGPVRSRPQTGPDIREDPPPRPPQALS